MYKSEHTVLIIDDDPATVKLIAESIRNEFHVVFARSAEQGIQRAQAKPHPTVILLDVMMPNMDGFDVCRVLKSEKQTRNIPIIFVTALSDTKQQEKGFELGAVDFVIKPIEIPILKARVRTHAQLRQQMIMLETMAGTDPLTGCANRRKFDEIFESELKRVKRDGTSLGFLMLDIDDFKAYNDNYGHGKGDECLVKISQILRSTFGRSADLVARIGGEEFTILLPNTDLESCQQVAEDLLCNIRAAAIPTAYSQVADYVTVSIGYGSFDADCKMHKQQIFEQVDKAMYEAKNNNKDQAQAVTS